MMRRHTGVPRLLAVFAIIGLTPPAKAFSCGRSARTRTSFLFPASASGVVEADTGSDPIDTSISSTPPSWDELSSDLAALATDEAGDTGEEGAPQPLVTLYRDTNGWCPFCERVWLVLRAKGIPYAEEVVSLQKKPDWYKALVPTALVPAVLFHGEVDGGGDERRIVWESASVLRALDEAFPNHGPPLMREGEEDFDNAVRMGEDLSMAGFAFAFAGRNATLTEDERDERRSKFMAELDRLDGAISEFGGPFRLGSNFTAVDAILVPMLERWRHQLPITANVDILEARPGLVKWFEAMDAFEPYRGRVMGDKYSWTATNSMFLRFFGGGEDKPEISALIERADAAAETLTSAFVEDALAMEEDGDDHNGYSREAAAKLIENHEAIVGDCTRADPVSQAHIGRAVDEDSADAVLRYAASILLSSSDGVVASARRAPLVEVAGGKAKDAALAARTVASRLCVPRDMSAPAACTLRGVLATVAGRLDEEGA